MDLLQIISHVCIAAFGCNLHVWKVNTNEGTGSTSQTYFVLLNSDSRPFVIVTDPSPAPTRKSPVFNLQSAVTPLLKFSLGPFTWKMFVEVFMAKMSPVTVPK